MAIACEEYGAKFFANGAAPSGVLEHPGIIKDPERVRNSWNDLLYDGRKFAGKAWMFIQNIGYIENTVVTCEYLPEKQYFDRLFHHPKEKQITGMGGSILTSLSRTSLPMSSATRSVPTW